MRETMLVNFRKNSTSNTHNLYPHRTSRNMYTGCTRNRNINRKGTIHCGKVSRKCRMIIFDTDLIFESKSILSKTKPCFKNCHSKFSIYFRFAPQLCVHRVYNRARSFVQLIIFQVLYVLIWIAI